MNGTYKFIEYETYERYVLQLKTICTTNLHNLVYVHWSNATYYKKKDGQVGTDYF